MAADFTSVSGSGCVTSLVVANLGGWVTYGEQQHRHSDKRDFVEFGHHVDRGSTLQLMRGVAHFRGERREQSM